MTWQGDHIVTFLWLKKSLEPIEAEEMAWIEQPYSSELTLPPLACVIFQVEQHEESNRITHGNERTPQK